MKKRYIVPEYKVRNIRLASLLTISIKEGENPIIDDPITSADEIGAKQNSIFDRVFIDEQ